MKTTNSNLLLSENINNANKKQAYKGEDIKTNLWCDCYFKQLAKKSKQK